MGDASLKSKQQSIWNIAALVRSNEKNKMMMIKEFSLVKWRLSKVNERTRVEIGGELWINKIIFHLSPFVC